MGHTMHVVNNNHHKVAATLLRPSKEAGMDQHESCRSIHDTNVRVNKQNKTKQKTMKKLTV